MIKQATRKRTAWKRNEIVDSIHSQIISGRLKPNDRLPTRRYLQQEFDSSMVTIQQAIDQLAEEGFIESRGVEGTFVSVNPPHLNQYAVIVNSSSLKSDSSIYWKGLLQEFINKNKTFDNDEKIKLYFCQGKGSNSDFDSISRQVSRHCVAGLIFIDHPFPFADTVLVSKSGIPRVSITGRENLGKYNSAAVIPGESFIAKALDYFVEKGKSRIALVTNPRARQWWTELEKAAAARQLEIRPHWRIVSHRSFQEGVRNLTNLLMHLPEQDGPDALLITDDNLTEQAVFGLIDSKSKAVENLEIVSHANFPFQVPTPLHVNYLGIDLKQVVDACIRCLERQSKGEDPIDVEETAKPFFINEMNTQ